MQVFIRRDIFFYTVRILGSFENPIAKEKLSARKPYSENLSNTMKSKEYIVHS